MRRRRLLAPFRDPIFYRNVAITLPVVLVGSYLLRSLDLGPVTLAALAVAWAALVILPLELRKRRRRSR